MSTCYASVELCGLRATLLDAEGAPLVGADSVYTTDAAIQAEIGLDVEAASRLDQKNGCGVICATVKKCARILGSSVKLQLCQLDAELLYMLTGGTLLEVGGQAVGYEVPAPDAGCPNGVALELWTQAWDVDQQAVVSGDLAYYRFGFPKVTFTLDGFTLADAILQVPVTGDGSANSQFGLGPFNDWPTPGITQALGFFLDDALPTAACGPTALQS